MPHHWTNCPSKMCCFRALCARFQQPCLTSEEPHVSLHTTHGMPTPTCKTYKFYLQLQTIMLFHKVYAGCALKCIPCQRWAELSCLLAHWARVTRFSSLWSSMCTLVKEFLSRNIHSPWQRLKPAQINNIQQILMSHMCTWNYSIFPILISWDVLA